MNNYLILIVLLLLGGGAYYEHQQLAEDEQKLSALQQTPSELAAKVASLQADNQKLTADKTALTASLAQAQSALNALSSVQKQAGAVSGTATVAVADTPAAPSPAAGVPVGVPAGAPPVALTIDQMSQGIVIIKGDKGQGTGFLIKTADGPAVVTNLHVLANNPNIKIFTNTDVQITPTGLKGAVDRDLALLPIPDGPYTYLSLATDLNNTVHPGDILITPGNSQGGGVVLNTKGKLLGVGPDRVEFSNPIYHGNSGGPVFHIASGTVLGVVTEAMKVDMSNDLDKTSYQSRDSVFSSSMRYFGLRIDTVPKWETYDPRRFDNEIAFLDQFDQQSRRLDSYLNARPKSGNQIKLYLTDDRIMSAHQNFGQLMAGNVDASSKLYALQKFCFDLDAIADRDMEAIQNMNNFYSFDQQRAQQEIAYRKALKAEIQVLNNDLSRIDLLPQFN